MREVSGGVLIAGCALVLRNQDFALLYLDDIFVFSCVSLEGGGGMYMVDG